MACKKSELVSALNSFGSARATGDGNLIQFSVNLIGQLIDTLEFAPEEEPISEDELAAERADNV
jgi:hypothetical protein